MDTDRLEVGWTHQMGQATSGDLYTNQRTTNKPRPVEQRKNK